MIAAVIAVTLGSVARCKHHAAPIHFHGRRKAAVFLFLVGERGQEYGYVCSNTSRINLQYKRRLEKADLR